MIRKLLATLMVGLGISLLGLFGYGQYLARQANDTPRPMLILEDAKVISDDPTAGFVADDGLNSPKPADLTQPNVYYVSATRGRADNGSELDPWRDLQAALCRLKPGDTLMVLDGDFGHLRIDERCAAGEPNRPIEVYFSTLSQLGSGSGALITIGQPYWSIFGAELPLGQNQIGFDIAPNTHTIRIESAKIYGGSGAGIQVGHGAHDIEIMRSHIHHIGTPDSKGHALVLHPGVHGVSIKQSKIHHIGTQDIEIVSPSSNPALAFLPEATYTLDASTANPSEDDQWWVQDDSEPKDR